MAVSSLHDSVPRLLQVMVDKPACPLFLFTCQVSNRGDDPLAPKLLVSRNLVLEVRAPHDPSLLPTCLCQAHHISAQLYVTNDCCDCGPPCPSSALGMHQPVAPVINKCCDDALQADVKDLELQLGGLPSKLSEAATRLASTPVGCFFKPHLLGPSPALHPRGRYVMAAVHSVPMPCIRSWLAWRAPLIHLH